MRTHTTLAASPHFDWAYLVKVWDNELKWPAYHTYWQSEMDAKEPYARWAREKWNEVAARARGER